MEIAARDYFISFDEDELSDGRMKLILKGSSMRSPRKNNAEMLRILIPLPDYQLHCSSPLLLFVSRNQLCRVRCREPGGRKFGINITELISTENFKRATVVAPVPEGNIALCRHLGRDYKNGETERCRRDVVPNAKELANV